MALPDLPARPVRPILHGIRFDVRFFVSQSVGLSLARQISQSFIFPPFLNVTYGCTLYISMFFAMSKLITGVTSLTYISLSVSKSVSQSVFYWLANSDSHSFSRKLLILPMGVHLNVLGHVVVDNQGDVLDVDTTTRHVRGHQNVLVSSLQA